MPKEAFGGDIDDEVPEERKKMGLDKFGLRPDTNIRDLFWKIMGSYAATKKPGIELEKLGEERFALMRVAVSVLSNPEGEKFGLPSKFISLYSSMMMLDGKWRDEFGEFLEISLNKKHNIFENVANALKKLAGQDEYKEIICRYMMDMLRNNEDAPVALAHVAFIKDAELSRTLKKELVIFARGDIGQNQHNAIESISVIKEEPEVKKAFIILLSHWDKDARAAAARALVGIEDEEVKKAAKEKLNSESNAEIKKILKRIAK